MKTRKSRPRKGGCLGSLFRMFLRLVLTLVLILMVPVFINAYMIISAQNDLRTPEELTDMGYDAALVFGAGLNPDGTPSPILAERLDTGIALYQSGACRILLMSGDGGGQDPYHNETRAMSRYAQARGVPPEAIWIDPLGLSTRHSLERAQKEYGLDRVVLVSQKFHLYRAIYLGQTQGLTVYGVPCDTQDWSNQKDREVKARLKDFTRVQITRLPAPLTNRLLPYFDLTVESMKEDI